MPRSYRHISDYEKEILETRAAGRTKRETSEKFEFNMKQITKFVTRYDSKSVNSQQKLP